MLKEMTLIPNQDFTAKVSSVLGRDVKTYGKKYMFDACDDTCWNSDQGTPQWIELNFHRTVTITGFQIQFQGGFAGKSIQIQAKGTSGMVEVCYPMDSNSVQNFSLAKPLTTDEVKFLFPESTDTYGRIIVYKLQIFQMS